MDIIDSITKQVIIENEDVIVMFLANSRSEDNSVGLINRLTDQYVLASLPIKAKWTGDGFEQANPKDIALASLARSMGMDEASSLGDITSSLWDYGLTKIEKPSWNCSNIREYSLFVTQRKTLEKMASIKTINEHVPLLEGEDHLQMALVHARLHASHAQISNHDVPQDQKDDFFDQGEKLSRMSLLQCSHVYLSEYEDPTPYAASALNRSDQRIFSVRLNRQFNRQSFLLPSGDLDEESYSQFYLGVHLGAAITHAIQFMDIPLAPTNWAQSSHRSTARMELMSMVLTEDLRAHCEESSEYDNEPRRVIRDLVAPLKSCVSDLTRLERDLDDQGMAR